MSDTILFAIKHWRWLAGAAVLALALLFIHAYGQTQYKAGQAQVQATWDAASAQHQINVEQSLANAMAVANQSSQAYQEGKKNEAERIRVVRETVIRTVSGPCLDDAGLFNVNQAIGGVPAASAAR